jgi:uncharacterized protein
MVTTEEISKSDTITSFKPSENNYDIELRSSPIHGSGVYAKRKFLIGDVIEECRFITIDQDQSWLFNNIAFYKSHDSYIIALGYGSLYNHTTQPNTKYHIDSDRKLLVFTAIDTIEEDDEILINYGNEWFIERGIELRPMTNKTRYRVMRVLGLTLLLIATAAFLPPNTLLSSTVAQKHLHSNSQQFLPK